jgi:hypothetical protein
MATIIPILRKDDSERYHVQSPTMPLVSASLRSTIFLPTYRKASPCRFITTITKNQSDPGKHEGFIQLRGTREKGDFSNG